MKLIILFSLLAALTGCASMKTIPVKDDKGVTVGVRSNAQFEIETNTFTAQGVERVMMADAETGYLRDRGQMEKTIADTEAKYLTAFYANMNAGGGGELTQISQKVAGMEKGLDAFIGALAGGPAGPSAAGDDAAGSTSAAPVPSQLTKGQALFLRAEVERATTVGELQSLVARLTEFAKSEEDKRFLALVKGSVDAAAKLPKVDQGKRLPEIKKSLLDAMPQASESAPAGTPTAAPTAIAPQAPVTATPPASGAADRFVADLNSAKSFNGLAAAFENAAAGARNEEARAEFVKVADMLKGYAKLTPDDQSARFGEVKAQLVGASATYRSLIK